MDWLYWLILLAGIVIGFVIACVITFIRSAKGTFNIYTSDPEKDLFKLELDDLNAVFKKKYVRLKIVQHSDYTQK